MNGCADILLISSIACKIAECVNDNELELLAADLTLLGDALSAIAVRRAICNDICDKQATEDERIGKDSNESNG